MGPPEVALVKLLVSLAAMLLLVVEADLQLRRRTGEFRRTRSATLAVLGAVGALSWWNLFQFHYPGFLQGHEFYHYYLGAKYFPELGYTRLYSCTAVADAEVIPRKKLQELPLRDLASTGSCRSSTPSIIRSGALRTSSRRAGRSSGGTSRGSARACERWTGTP